MSHLANAFSVLALDAEDDQEGVDATVVAAPAASAVSSASSAKEVKLAPNPDEVKGNKKENKKDKALANGSVAVIQKPVQEAPAVLLQEYKLPLVWVDLEMTGLNVEVDRILEVACIITDGMLTKSIEGPNLVIHQTKDCLDNMGQWCQEHHGASGLTERVLLSTVTEEEAEKQLIEFVKKHVGTYTPLLAGNSIYVDLSFLKKYMPSFAGLFYHVLVDVSSVRALCLRWFPRDFKRAPPKEQNHRALDDIRESIQELKYYRENIFKQKSKK